MKLVQQKMSKSVAASLLSLALLGATGAAWAAGGNVTGVTATPNAAIVNDVISIKVM